MRRLPLVFAAVLLFAAAGCGWPMFHYGPEHGGFNPLERRIGPSNVSKLIERWSAGTGNAVRSSPAVVNGVVYVTSENDTLYAFDATSGSPLWNGPLGTVLGWSSPAVVDGVVYVGSGDHRLYAFDATGSSAHCTGVSPARTCTPLWTAPTGGFLGSSPNVVRGVVYVSSFDNKLYAFDATGSSWHCTGVSPARTCTPLWTAPFGGPIEMESPAVANGVVYVGSTDDKVYAFDATGSSAHCIGVPSDRTCLPLWTTTAGTGPPAVANGVLYVGAFGGPTGFQGGLFAFDAAGRKGCSGTPKVCTPLWSAPAGGGAESAPAIAVWNGVHGRWRHRQFRRRRRVRCRGEEELLGQPEGLHTAVARDHRQHRRVVPRGGERCRLRRLG